MPQRPVKRLMLVVTLAGVLFILSSAQGLTSQAHDARQLNQSLQHGSGHSVSGITPTRQHQTYRLASQVSHGRRQQLEAGRLFPTDMGQWNYTNVTIEGGTQQRLWSIEDLEAAISVRGRQDGALRQLLDRLQGGQPIVVLALGTSVTRRGGCFHRDRCVQLSSSLACLASLALPCPELMPSPAHASPLLTPPFPRLSLLHLAF